MFFLFVLLASAEAIKIAKPGCQKKCGEITIHYPFGIGSHCSIDRWAEVTCDTTFNPPKLFFTNSIPYQVVELSNSSIFGDYKYEPITAFVRVKNNISTFCSGAVTSSYDSFHGLNNTPFFLSKQNKFTLIGSYMYGVIHGALNSDDRLVGCATASDKIKYCQVDIPFFFFQVDIPGATEPRPPYSIVVKALSASGMTDTRCGSAFLSDEEYSKFNASDVESLRDSTVRLSYRIGNQSCEDAEKDPTSFACKENSNCLNFDLYPTNGYYCHCIYGYEGNPYLDPGCQVVNMCDDPQNIRTCGSSRICINGIGRFYCEKRKRKPFIWIITGVGLGLFLLGGSLWMYYIKRKQLLKLSEKLNRLNARLLLIQDISSHAKIFTAKNLQQATNNYHESRILGEGGYGTVYKGILPDQSIVAVKKSKITKKSQFDDFINEVAILTKIDHRNIVKLLGCSVETEKPMLVYEFVSNGTLSDHIFKKSGMPYSSMSWGNRVRIAAEVAGALAYLHSASSLPIIHRDVKSSNILLDDQLTAKVADFGVSKVNHLDQTEIGTLVKGTPGYWDPEYVRTSKLTEKSDVFSYGVVLAELLTGKKSISFERAQGERNLSTYFNAPMDDERLLHIVEEGMVNEENIQEVRAVTALVQRCLNLRGEERPYMKEVASELEALRGFSKKQ